MLRSSVEVRRRAVFSPYLSLSSLPHTLPLKLFSLPRFLCISRFLCNKAFEAKYSFSLSHKRSELSGSSQSSASEADFRYGRELLECGEFYGLTEDNSLVLLERYFERYPEDADKVVISIKGGLNPKTHQKDASPKNMRCTLDDSIAQLDGRKKIDLFEFGRLYPAVPLEVTFGMIDKEYVQTGKIGGISLSEVRAETIHEAVKHTKILAVEGEISV